jgi:NAD-dependent SIR2 family protein deacetylase
MNKYEVGSAKCTDCKKKYKGDKGWKSVPPALYCPSCASRHGYDPSRVGVHKRRGRPSKKVSK